MLFLPIFAILAFITSVLAGSGSITKPAKGTSIMPGQSFAFHYDGMAEYSVSGYNYSVWLFTSLPFAFLPSQSFGAGHFFGRYNYANYPGVPYATNPAPANFTMPDLSQSYGGFGQGQDASGATVYLAVIEEYAAGSTFGLQMNLATTQLMYNGTQHH